MELTELLLENAYIGSDFNVQDFWDKEETDEDNQTIKYCLKRFAKSQFLKKKKLFYEMDQKISEVQDYDYFGLQQKFEKLMLKDEETIRKFKQAQLLKLNPKIEEDEKEIMFEEYYQNFITSCIIFKNLLSEQYFEGFNKEKLLNVNAVLQDLLSGIKIYVNRWRDKLVIQSLPEKENEKEISDFKDFDKTVSKISKQLDDLENIEYDKLIALREKNNKLMIIKNHIKKQFKKFIK